MTFRLPSHPFFGTLQLTEVWLSYEGPRLFVASNYSGQSFLFNALDEDEQSITYLVVPISAKRNSMIRSGGLELRSAFADPEDEYVFKVRQYFERDSSEINSLLPRDLLEEDLPEPDVRITIPSQTLPTFSAESLAARSLSEGRLCIALRLAPPVLVRSEYPVRPLRDALGAVQDLVEALVQEGSGVRTVRGPLPRQVVEDAELSVLELQAASFVAVLAPSRTARSGPNIQSLDFEMPATTAALASLKNLLEACAEPVDLAAYIGNIGQRVITRFRNLLEISVNQQTPLRFYFARPRQRVDEIAVSESSAAEGLLVLSQMDEHREQISLDSAVLVGINLRTWAFELHDNSVDPGKFSGKVTQPARDEIAGLPTGEGYRYRAVVVAETEFSSLTDELKTRYSLQSISPYS